MNVKRIGIFAFYDESGYVDEYVEVLLNSIQNLIQRLVIVVSGKIEEKSYGRLKKYSNDIFVRKNCGYDGGAYKDVFTKFLVNEDWEQWDEILLFNDTFYAPLYPWEDVFKSMKSDNVDFWGLSRYPGGGRKLSTGKDIPSHIQGYFLVCKKKLFLSQPWKNFWDNLVYPTSYWEAVEKFEIYFSIYFSNYGFLAGAYTDNTNIAIKTCENPYTHYIEELIKNYKFPIMKRKLICLEHLNEAKNTIDHIKENINYNVDLIYSHIQRLCREGRMSPIEPFDFVQIEQFYNSHRRIFIYGHGVYGKGLAIYFEYKNWNYEGFIVSKQNEKDKNVFVYDDMKFMLEDGIILALGKNAFSEVYPVVKNDLPDNQLCYPVYDL